MMQTSASELARLIGASVPAASDEPSAIQLGAQAL